MAGRMTPARIAAFQRDQKTFQLLERETQVLESNRAVMVQKYNEAAVTGSTPAIRRAQTELNVLDRRVKQNKMKMQSLQRKWGI